MKLKEKKEEIFIPDELPQFISHFQIVHLKKSLILLGGLIHQNENIDLNVITSQANRDEHFHNENEIYEINVRKKELMLESIYYGINRELDSRARDNEEIRFNQNAFINEGNKWREQRLFKRYPLALTHVRIIGNKIFGTGRKIPWCSKKCPIFAICTEEIGHFSEHRQN